MGNEYVRTTVRIEKGLWEEAKALRINLSDVMNTALRAEIQLRRREKELFVQEYAKQRVFSVGRESDLTDEDELELAME